MMKVCILLRLDYNTLIVFCTVGPHMQWFIGAALRVTAAVLVVLQLSIIETGKYT